MSLETIQRIKTEMSRCTNKSTLKNDNAWGILFKALKIIEIIKKQKFFDISSEEINVVREARLMCKFDSYKSMPAIFRDNGLSCLSIKNGTYRISKAEPFLEIEKSTVTPETIKLKNPFFMLNYEDPDEASAISIAKDSGILNKVFGEETEQYSLGRRRSSELSFTLNDVSFNVQGTQIEVDGIHVGNKAIHLMEAKVSNGPIGTQTCRQLLYPHLDVINLSNKVKSNKKIKSYFFVIEKNKGKRPLYRFIPYIYNQKDNNCGKFDFSKERSFYIK